MRVATPSTHLSFPSAARARDAVLDLLFQPRCIICDRWDTHLCDACIAEFPRAACAAAARRRVRLGRCQAWQL
jgi:hypothetical protein